MNSFKSLTSYLSTLTSFFTNLLFPNSCLCCGVFSDIPLCEDCVHCLPHRKKWHCPHCQEQTTPLGMTCSACFGKTPLDGIFSASRYKHPTVHRVITAYKYGFVKSLEIPLGKFLLDTLSKNDLPLPDLILAVPLHPRRLRWRGFNQSELLAQTIAQKLLPHISLDTPTLLTRQKFTLPQAKTDNQKSRRKNLKSAFIFSGDPTLIQNKRIWLIDDVATTGTTLAECARVLKKKGAREVWGVVVAS